MQLKTGQIINIVCLILSSIPAAYAGIPFTGHEILAAVPKLSSELTMDDFSIQPPQGLALYRMDKAGNKTYIWQIPAHKNDLTGALSITIAPVLPKSPEQILNDWMTQIIAPRIDNLVQSDIETKDINGIEFARVYWKGKDPGNPKEKIHGFTYLTTDSSHTYVIDCGDVEPHNQQSLPTAEASAMTFKPMVKALSDWSSDTQFSNQLAENYNFEGLSIRPPLGYEYTHKEASNYHSLTWLGNGPVGPTRPSVTIAIQPDNHTADISFLETSGLNGFLSGLKKEFNSNVINTPYEYGAINNIPFARTRYAYDANIAGNMVKIHGVTYCTLVSGNLIFISGADSEPDSASIMPMLEASILTFGKR